MYATCPACTDLNTDKENLGHLEGQAGKRGLPPPQRPEFDIWDPHVEGKKLSKNYPLTSVHSYGMCMPTHKYIHKYTNTLTANK